MPYFMEACLRQVLGWSRSTFTILLRLFLRAKINGVEKSLSIELRNYYCVWRIFKAFWDAISGLSRELRCLVLLKSCWLLIL